MDDKLKKIKIIALLSSIGCAPFFLMLFTVFVVMLFVLGLLKGGDSTAQNCVPVQSANSVCSSITVNGKTMSVDDYVAGVVEAEVGDFDNLEIKKAIAIDSRTYALNTAKKGSNGTCDMGTAGPSSQAYSDSPDELSKQAATETSGMILVDETGNPAFAQYDAFAWYEEKDGYFYLEQGGLEEKNQKIDSNWVRSRYSDSTLDWYKNHKHGNGMSQVGGYYLATEKNYTYDKILTFYYSDEGYTLASTSGTASQICSDGNLQTLDHYNLGHDGLSLLNHTLSSSEISSLNSYLENEVKKAGHGSGEAVAAVGQGLVYWLETNKKAYLSYYWGGGHGGFGNDGTVIGGNPDWGSTKYGVDNHNGNNRPYFGMDCSGFVSWATRMGCDPKFGSDVSGGWNDRGKELSSLSDVKPGDVLSNDGHIKLVVHNGEFGIIVAEETGSQGLVFHKIDSASGYHIRSMSSWYASNCTDIQPGTGSDSGSTFTDGNLTTRINNYINGHNAGGNWSVYVKNMKTNNTVNINSSNKMISASVIKLFVMASTYDQISSGKITETSTLKSNIRSMITVSSNDATNAVINASPNKMTTINNYISGNRYGQTSLNRYLGVSNRNPENYTSAKDVGNLLEKIYKKGLPRSDDMLNLLKAQTLRGKIPAGIPTGVTVGNKTGELSDVENDAAIVYAGGDYVIVVLSQNVTDTATARATIKEISSIVYNSFK